MHCKTARRARAEEIAVDVRLIRIDAANGRCVVICMRSNSATGTRTRVARVRAEYPNQLDYSGVRIRLPRQSQTLLSKRLWIIFCTACATERPRCGALPPPCARAALTLNHMGTAPVGSMCHYPVGWPCCAHPTADLVRFCPRAVAARSARRAPPCRSRREACASDCGRGAQPWARTAHIRMTDALVPGSRRARRVARARAPWRTRTTPHSRGPCMWLGGVDAQRGGPCRRHRTYRGHV